jgi:pimeloyl-ACP methyl ester carboxylesterase
MSIHEETQTKPGQGQMFDVGGHRLFFRSSGEGSPTVILESGLGGATGAFVWLERAIAKFTRVCVYDRAGLGKSDTADGPYSFLESVQQLHTLLEKAGVKGPYILVGHSIGGILIREFTRRYPDEVAGLIFLDSSHPRQMEYMPPGMKRQGKILIKLLNLPWLAKPLINMMVLKDAKLVPPETAAELKAEFKSDKHFKATRAEYRDLDVFLEKTRDLGGLGERPIAVFSASMPEGTFMQTWHKLQGEIAALSPNSTHQIVKGARHVTLVTDQSYAALIVAEIQKMAEQLRAEKTENPA